MCVPFLPLALAAAGTVAKFIGDKQQQNAREKTFNAERDRQKAFTDQQQARFEDSLHRTQATTDPANMDAAAQRRESVLSHVIVPQSAEGSYLPGSSSAPTTVATASDAAGAHSAAVSQGLAHAIAALGGTGDAMQNLNIGIGRDAQSIGQIGGFKAGSLGVLDAELKAAEQKGAFLRGIGGLAQQIGTTWLGASHVGKVLSGAAGTIAPPVGGAALGKGLSGAVGTISRSAGAI